MKRDEGIMSGFMLDTDALNLIVENYELIKNITLAIENCKITLFITHIQIDQINDIPDSNSEKRNKISNFILN